VPQSRVLRLAAPSDQGMPIVSKLMVSEGDVVEAGAVVAILAAEAPAKLLLKQASAKVASARAEVESVSAAAARADGEIALQAIDAQFAHAGAEAELAVARAQASRKRLPDEGVRECEVALAAQVASLERLKADRVALEAKLDAAVFSAKVQSDETSGSRQRVALAALEEARAGRVLALREHDARMAAALGEAEVLRAKLGTAKALNALAEREEAEVSAIERQVTAAAERIRILKALRTTVQKQFETKVAAAAAAVDEAVVAEALAEARLGLTRVKSPVRGRVLRVVSRPGTAVGPAGIVEVADLGEMGVEAEVSVPDLARVRVGAHAVVRVPGLKNAFKGRVARIGLRAGTGALADESPVAFKDLRVVPVEIAVEGADGAALAAYTGAQVLVRIGGGEENAGAGTR
jgi:HlyD family secretion protein